MQLLHLVLLASLLFTFACSGIRAADSERQLWVYCSQNLWVDQNVDGLITLLRRAARVGYTHVLLSDSKFSKLGDMDERYFKNIDRVKKAAAELNIQIVPAVFAIGYSNDLLWHDPNLIEGLPVTNALFVVRNGHGVPQPDASVSLRGGDFSQLGAWDWKDPVVVADDGAALIRNPGGQLARIVQKLRLTPFRQYHLTVRIKTEKFEGTPEVKVLAGNSTLNANALGVKPTQDWTVHHVVFNSLGNGEANLYLGCWGGKSGSLWFDDAQLEEIGLLNLIRRQGAPLVLKRENGGLLQEGLDYAPLQDRKMGNGSWKGEYDVWHEPPTIATALPGGTRLRASYYHAVTVHDDQAMICPSEPRTLELLRDQARRMHSAWGAKGYMMSHDEIRVFNWCGACQARNLDAGPMLADNVRACTQILRAVNPSGKIYVWSDMFDPNHNAHKNYYLVRGDLSGSWEGLDKEVIVLPWHFEKRSESLRWFADRGHAQVIAAYYDAQPEQVRLWLEAARALPRVVGVMYTTWEQKYADLERFAEFTR